MSMQQHSHAKLIVVLPTYNEARNLAPMVEQLLALGVPGLTVLVVDDNSPDGTGQIADELAHRFADSVRVLHRQTKEGLGRAYVAGMKSALEMGADYVVQMDADFSHSPSVIPAMLQGASDHDVVIGSRYVPGGGLDEHWSWYRRFLS